MKVVVAMSGGVDSSVAAYLLRKKGFEVIGVSYELWDARDIKKSNVCCSVETINIAKEVAKRLGIEHFTVDVRDVFYTYVIESFCDSYAAGLTPNPCILCNKFIKFDLLLKKARELGADMIATGHYARVEGAETSEHRTHGTDKKEHIISNKRFLLKKGIDVRKDQSYFLYVMRQKELSKTIFPLGGLRKEETREIAKEAGLINALRPESQEICFVGDGNYIDFIKNSADELLTPGPLVNTEGKILGEHSGLALYTIGQRKRLGVASSDPLYVVDIRRDSNTLVVGRREDVMKKAFIVKGLNYISIETLSETIKADVKIRSAMKEEPAMIIPLNNNEAMVEFDAPQWAPTPGQSAVFYAGEIVIGGGVIE